MNLPADDLIEGLLVQILTDGFNRSLGVLEAAGFVDTTEMRRQYHGGSKSYDLVTDRVAVTARLGAMRLRQLIAEANTPEVESA